MDAADGKLFVGGISWETTEEDLRDHFHQYGTVVEAVIMKDRNTGRSRGFGFVSFSNSDAADLAILDKHTINNRVVEAKRAVPRAEQQSIPRSNTTNGGQSPGGLVRTKKIFVGGLASSVTREEFRRYFEQFGPLSDAVVMYDHDTQQPRGFGFVTFASEESTAKVLQTSFHELNGKMVEVKPAVPRELSPVTQSPSTAARERQALYAVADVNYGTRGYPYAAYGNPVAMGNFPGGYGAPAYGAYGGPAGYGPGYGSRTGWSAAAAYPYAGMWGFSGYPGAQVAGSNYSGYYGSESGYEAGYGGRDTGYGGGSPGNFGTGRTEAGAGNYGSGYGDAYGYSDSKRVDEIGTDSVGFSAAEEAISGYASGYGATSGYGAPNKQVQRSPDTRFRPYPTSNDRI